MTAREDADDTGIVVAAVDRDGQGYVLDDLACKLPNAGRVEQLDHGAIMRQLGELISASSAQVR